MYANIEQTLNRAAQPTVDAINQMRDDPANESLRPVLTSIRDRFCEPGYTITELKATARASNRLFRVFRFGVGLTPWQFVRECRMGAGMRLLRDTSIPVSQVAFLVGYGAFYPFQKLCVRWCGLSPDPLRTRLRSVKTLLRQLPEEVLSWHFLEKCRRGEISHEEMRQLIRHFEELYALGDKW